MSLIVRSFKVSPLKAPLVVPFRIATGQHDELDNILFRIELADGTPGFGEAAVATHITGETVAQTTANLNRAGQALVGQDMMEPMPLLYSFCERFGGNHAALAAFEMAVLDAYTRAAGVPLWRFFGTRPERLATDITVVIGSVGEAAAQAKRFYARGFRAFKVKVSGKGDTDIARLLTVAANAPKAAIIIDANQSFTAAGMMEFLKELKARDVRPVLLEQPVPKNNWDGLEELTRSCGIPVCADESAGSYHDTALMLERGVVNAINIKLMKTGLLEGAAIARLALSKGALLMMGAMMESSLAITAGAHVAAGVGKFKIIDLDTTFFIQGPLARSPYLNARGQFDLSSAGPGIGVEPAATKLPNGATRASIVEERNSGAK